MSKALSTNMNHWKILDVAASMAAELGIAEAAQKYAAWATELKVAINKELWLEDAGLYSIMKPTELDQAPVRRYELLGEALAIGDGIADDKRTASILQNYPHTAVGAAVVWPQTADAGVYHNRAIWPFVSSYLIKTAAKGRNADVVNRNFATLVNGAALNLSNMENFQFDNLSPVTPAINSDKQLWSAGGYIGAVLDVVFGRDTDQTGIRFAPYVTKQMHKDVFNGARQLQLRNLDYRGKKITVKVNLPALGASLDGAYTVKTMSVDGEQQFDLTKHTLAAQLKSEGPNIFEIGLIDNTENGGTAKVTLDSDYYGPAMVSLNMTPGNWAATKGADGLVNLSWTGGTPEGTTVSVYRNGTRVATGVTGSNWSDPDSNAANPGTSNQALCYSLERQYDRGLRNVSQRTNPACYWGDSRLTFLFAFNATNNSVPGSVTRRADDEHGRNSWADWGTPGEVLTFTFTPTISGTYDILLPYGNNFNNPTTGITAGVKQMEVVQGTDTVAKSVLVMPHLLNWTIWGESTPLQVKLVEGRSYTIRVSDYYNMSYLASNALYGGSGGAAQLNRVNIGGITLRRRFD